MDHIYEYFEQKRVEFQRLSLAASERELDQMFAAAPDGLSGIILGVLHMDDDAIIQIHERVVLKSGRPHRERYAYFLVIEGAETRGYERHTTHDPPHHRHLAGHAREPWQEVSFKEAVEEFRDLLAQVRERDSAESEP